ncbi:serine hydrolase domain-containing protein [Photobacterium rosenbergii]|uniref:serine hydrolase domain-containing protein n=1 Tax=Photobacterium rosenbergii TaxID=294936 RepID=UPI001C99D0D3|nr:serine hydrolase domain-containing protein [Photobacterium rosenbergii]MBY5947816.1 beta-lactamase family protein [Photobacterium rosenbergii]
MTKFKKSKLSMILALSGVLTLSVPTFADTIINPNGPTLAKQSELSTAISVDEINDISRFFNKPENKVKIQFPSAETEFAWVNMSKFYPTVQVPRSGQVSVLPYDINEDINNVKYMNYRSEEEISVDEHFATKPIDAMIVVKNGKVVFERYKTMRPQDKHLWMSVSKVTGATLLAMLEQEGKVDVQKPVSHYLPELKGSVWDTVKVEESLDMASGLNGTEHDEPTPDSRTNPDQIWFRWAATDAVGMAPDVRGRGEDWNTVLKSMERRKPGHERFEYNSINTFVVNRIVEHVSGKPLSELFAERIWSKLGMEHDAYYIVSPSGNTLGFMGVNSTLRDMARFGMAYTPSGNEIAGEKVISDEILSKIHDREYIAQYPDGYLGKKLTKNFADDAGKISNRYQWDAVTSEGDMYKAGVGGQGIYVSPSTNTVVAWFATGDGGDQEESMARAIVKAIN